MRQMIGLVSVIFIDMKTSFYSFKPTIPTSLTLMLFIVLASLELSAQRDTLSTQAQYVTLNLGLGSNTYAADASIHYDWHFGQHRRIVVGSGLRFQAFSGSDVYFTSAPPTLAANPSHQDTVLAPAPWIYSINMIINLGYYVTPKLYLGFNIDGFGFSFGPHGTPTFIQDGVEQTVKVKPTPWNVLLVGPRDVGSLKAQFYGRYHLNDRWGLQFGLQNMFSELTTYPLLQTVPEDNKRFRAASAQGFVGVHYTF